MQQLDMERKIELKKSFLVLLFSIIILTGCSDEIKTGGPVLHQETIGDLAYEIRLSKKYFGMNDEILVLTTVTNRGDEALTYVSGSTGCPRHVVINIVHKESTARLESKSHNACKADITKSTLEPGQQLEAKSIFIAEHRSKSGFEPALPGTYDVQISLPPEDLETTNDYQSIVINPRPSTNERDNTCTSLE